MRLQERDGTDFPSPDSRSSTLSSSQLYRQKEIKHKCNRSHDDKLMECGQEHFAAHSSDVQCNVVADHRIHHDEHHHNRENNLLKLCFGIKKPP